MAIGLDVVVARLVLCVGGSQPLVCECGQVGDLFVEFGGDVLGVALGVEQCHVVV